MPRIDTIEDFKKFSDALVPTTVHSRTHGEVLVPCMNTVLVKVDLIVANLYNPNSVSGDKMDLLRQSIIDNGFCFPIVTIWDADLQKFIIIDGFHRAIIGGPDWLDFDYLPVVILQHDITKRMIATMQFNKARGVHQVDLDAEVIRALIEQGLSEDDIAIRLGIDTDTVHRYKQITGVAEIFKNAQYSLAWEIVETS
jgi:ParB-like chromosome segregation protein Spo0J